MDLLPFQGAWGKFIIAAVVIIALSQLAHRLLRPVVLRVAARSPVLLALAQRCDGPLHALVPLALLQVALQAMPDSLPGLAAVEHVNAALTIGAITWLVVQAIR